MSRGILEIIPSKNAKCCFCANFFEEHEAVIWLVLTDIFLATVDEAEDAEMSPGDTCVNLDWIDTELCHVKCLAERGYDFANRGRIDQKTP